MLRTFRIKSLALPFCMILLALGTKPATAQAACQAGESELTVVLPNGGERVICVPDAAISGLESAADHSPGNIVATQCPCFNTIDVQAMFDDAIEPNECHTILGGNGNTLMSCFDIDTADLTVGSDFTATDGDLSKSVDSLLYDLTTPMCGKSVSGMVSHVANLSPEQVDACFATLEAFFPSP